VAGVNREEDAAVRRFIEQAESKEDARAGLILAGILEKARTKEEEIRKLRQENGSLKRKMAYLERRARGRMHGLVDLFTIDREPDDQDE
jgi:hypothetical protein